MLHGLHRRAARKGLSDRIHLHHSTRESLGGSEPVDFALAFWTIHEVPDRKHLFQEIRSILKPQAHLLFVEPKLHVTPAQFDQSVMFATQAGLKGVAEPQVRLSRAILLTPA